MIRSAFNYLRYGWTRQKAEDAFDMHLATMIKLDGYEAAEGFDHSLACRSFLKSLSSLYPDLTVRFMARTVAAMRDPSSPEAWDCLDTMLNLAKRASHVDPRGVRDALVSVLPFMEHFPNLDRDAKRVLADFAKADPGYRPPPTSGVAVLNRVD